MVISRVKIFLLLIFVIFGFLVFGKAKAGAGDNVSGWAWSENIGWISFNCTNQGTCATVNYGVNINPSTGIFSGYAWSENIGWFDFVPAGPYPSSPNYSACLDFPGAGQTCDGVGDYKVSGWAKALTDGGGWDGWIKLRDSNYGVSWNSSTREMEGWAWSDMVIGWISFNCKNQGVCGTSNYKVIAILNASPVASNPYETFNTCAWGTTPQVAPGLSITLNWTYSDPEGDPQQAYEIWLDDDFNFTGAKFNYKAEPSASNAYALNLSNDLEGDWLSQLAWNTTYYWKVKVKDSAGNWSDWSPVDNFTTPLHAYPYIDFSWDPQAPRINQAVKFTDLSEVYGGATKSSWYWTFQDATPATSDQQNPKNIKFTSTGQKTVTLKVTDSTGYSCTDSKLVRVSLPLPEWKEIAPTF